MAKNKVKEEAPLCVSEYESGELICDGDPEAGDSNERAPCGWRDRCVGLQCHLAESGKDVSAIVEYKTKMETRERYDEVTDETTEYKEETEYAVPFGLWSKFEELCDKHIARYGVKEGKITKDPVGDPIPKAKQPDRRKLLRPSKRTQRAASRALSKRAKKRRDALMGLFHHFARQLDRGTRGTGYRFVKPKQALGNGMFYVANRLEKSGYVSVYCKNPRGKDFVVILAKFKPRDLTLDVMMPIHMDEFSKASRKELKLKHVQGVGLFQTIATGLQRQGVSLVAEIIAGLVVSGKMDLPEL